MRSIAKLFCALVATMSWVLALPSQALAAPGPCAGGSESGTPATAITRTFASGAKWSLNAQIAPCEGLVLTSIYYQPAWGTERLVLNRASLAELNVPYDNNLARYLDVTIDTSGLGHSAIVLAPAECDGTLSLGNKVCTEYEDGGYRYKSQTNYAEMHAVAVFLASQSGAYTYINRWEFREDGTIEVRMGLTGELNHVSTNAADSPSYGTSLGDPGQQAHVGLNHVHNFYYRLDFDLAGASDDVVSAVTYAPYSVGATCANNACGKTTYTPITTEGAQTWSSTANTFWLVQDKVVLNQQGRRVGYQIKPHYSGIWRGKTNGTEAWAQADLYVTRYNWCERYAARNTSQFLQAGCNPPAQNVSTMVSGETTDGQDIVVWFVNRHHHVTRDEDEYYMPIEWAEFSIEPRNFHYENPSPDLP